MSGRELVVERNPGELRIALREDGRVTDVILERGSGGSLIGSIWWARVLRVEPGIGAFIDLGRERPAFLPISGNPPVEGSALLVQVTKDAYAEKGPEVTRKAVLDDGLIALQPGKTGLSVSRDLTGSERAMLRQTMQVIVGENPTPGVLIQPAAWGRSDRMKDSWTALSEEWRRIADTKPGQKPRQVRAAPDPLLRQVQLLQPDDATVGDPGTAAKLRPLLAERVVLARRPFEALGIEDEIQRALAREIPIDGGRLVVDETEAMTVIDVDGTGDPVALGKAAADEIAHLIRLRNWGGLIVVDFPFAGRTVADKIERALRKVMDGVYRPVDCLGWTRAGLYEMTRSRQGPSLAQRLLEYPQARPTIESAALAALRAIASADGGRVRLTAAPEVVRWLQGDGAAALAETVRPVALVAEPSYGRERFDVTPG
jgi:ribonuclease G